MSNCKITVLKRILNEDLAGEYCPSEIIPCPCFEEGQEFLVDGLEKPADFCEWAWNDILRFVTALSTGGNFSQDIFQGWMKDDNVMIASCTDGLRPVVFKIERIK